MLKVLQILGDPTGGIRKHVHEIIRSSYDGRIEVHYAHGETVDLVGRMDMTEFESRHVECIALSVPKKPHPLDIINTYRLVRYCRTHGIDLVHGHGAKGGLYCRLVSLIARIPCVYTPHGGSVHARYGRLEGFLYRSVERLLKHITDLYLFESNYTFKSFVIACGDLKQGQYRINYNGIDPARYSPVRRWTDDLTSKVNLLVVGVLRDIKGQAVAIRALAKLAQLRGWNFQLHFCGDGPDKDDLKSLVDEYRLSDRVSFHGEVANVAQWYEKCSIVVIPSLFESFGYVAIEAALMKRPVIASAVGGLAEIIKNNETGLLFPAGDCEALADGVLRMITDVPRTDGLVVLAETNVKRHFSLNSMVQNIVNAYIYTLEASHV
jgi:glycosyltransferase involved in cell wall biosynthesis